MAASSSRVPHLARAIVEKRNLRLVNKCDPHGLVGYQTSTPNRSLLNTRSHASSSRSARVKSNPRALDKAPAIPQNRPSLPSRKPAPSPSTSTPDPPPNLYGVPPPEEVRPYNPSDDPERKRRYRTITFGFIVVVSGFIAYVYQSYQNDLRRYYAKGNILPQDADVSDRWKDPTRNFDREVDDAEMLMFLKWKRRRLVREAYGDVLEVSVGTGRNMDLYDTRPYSAAEGVSYGRDTRHMITSLTFNDESPVMIANAQKKWSDEQRKKRAADRFTGNINWYVGDAGDKTVIVRPPGGYDTIIQSWGICSMADPVRFLRHLGRLVRQPGETIQNSSPKRLREQEGEDAKGGRIFLLEHGRGKYGWLNKFLDKSAPMHADRYGCWYNKDISKVIEESGLIVDRVRRYNFGTTYEYVLRPAPGPSPGEETTVTAIESQVSDEASQRGWLSKFR